MAMAGQPDKIGAPTNKKQEPSVLIHSLPCVTQFVDTLNQSLKICKSSAVLSGSQRIWLGTVLVGIVVTGTLNWAAFERRSLKAFTQDRLRWMFYQAKIAWPLLLRASVGALLRHYAITDGLLVIDDTDKQRSKKTTKIAGAHKVKDKKTGGYFNGQELIFMVLVTDLVTFPVSFRWYRPDPKLTAWRKENKRLKRQGVPRDERPSQPKPDPDYPTKQSLALAMVEEFTGWFPDVTVKATLADALYGTGEFMDKASAVTDNAQVVSQLRSNQLVFSRGRKVALSDYFARQAGVETQLTIRGGSKKRVTLLAARLQVKAHGKRRFVVALKYEGETDYRFLVASDLSWRHQDIAALYTLRWLVEVFIQDWKAHAGWDRLTKHQGVEGSTRGVILSLLCDHLLLLHPEQSARLKNKQPGISAGCLIETLKAEALVGTIEDIVNTEDPTVALTTFTEALRNTLEKRSSSKHMAGRDTGRLEGTPSLRYREAA
jgi:hypothetical protein